MPVPTTADVIVAGGGVIGMSCAWMAAKAGIDVTVVDPAPGQGATHVAAGMLAPVTEAHFNEEELAQANVDSAALWPKFAADLTAESDLDIGFSTTGTLTVAADANDWAVLVQLEQFLNKLNLPVERLSINQVRRMEPFLARGIRGAMLAAQDYQVDNRALHRALMIASQRAGVTIVHDAVEYVEHQAGRVVGCRLREGASIKANTVLLSSGAWSPKILLPNWEPELPIRPVKGHILRLKSPKGVKLLSHTIRALVRGRPVYLVPRTDGSIVVGATTEEMGYDCTVQVGPVSDLLHDARAILPGVAECELLESTSGLRPASPDHRPLLGPFGPSGLLVATGHYRNGILLAPLSAQCILSLLTHSELPDRCGTLLASRFDNDKNEWNASQLRSPLL